MRRGLAWALAVTLWAAGAAACGDDGNGGAASGGTTTTAAATTTAPADLAAEVDAFCAKTEELSTIIQELAASGQQTATAEQQAQLSEIGGDAARMLMTLNASVPRMVPGDAARFQQCASTLGGTGGLPTG